MTIVHKVSSDMYEIIREDKTVTRVDGFLAHQELKKLNDVPPLEERQKEAARQCFVYVKESLTYGPQALKNDPEFSKYIKSLKTSQDIKVNTGCKIFDESLYNKALDEQRASIEKLKIEGDNTYNDVKLSSNERLTKCQAILREIQTLKSRIINKSESQFYTDEVLTIKITPQEALKIANECISNYNKSLDDAKKKAFDAEIDKDRQLFSEYDDEDLKLAKRLKRVIDGTAFYKMYQYTPFYKHIICLNYDSIEDYIMRDRPTPNYRTPEVVIDQKERGVLAYMQQIIRDYKELRRMEELKHLNESMQEA